MSGVAGTNDRRVSNGIGLPWVLFFIFLILKLTKTVDWSWWVVTAPLWVAYGLAFILVLLVLVIVAVKGDGPKHPRRF